MSFSDLLIGLAAPALQLVLLAILTWRKIYRRFPFFFAYTVYSVAAGGVLTAAILRLPAHYYEIYWTVQFFYSFVALLAIIEVFESVLRLFGFGGLGWRVLLPGAIAIIATIAIWRAVYHPLGTGPLVRFATASYSFEVGMRCLEVAILLLCIWPRRRFGVPWDYDLAIIGGLGIAALLTLAADLIGLKFRGSFEAVFQYLPSGVYIAVACHWVVVFSRPEAARPRLKMTVAEQQALLERVAVLLKKYWNNFGFAAIFSQRPHLGKF